MKRKMIRNYLAEFLSERRRITFKTIVFHTIVSPKPETTHVWCRRPFCFTWSSAVRQRRARISARSAFARTALRQIKRRSAGTSTSSRRSEERFANLEEILSRGEQIFPRCDLARAFTDGPGTGGGLEAQLSPSFDGSAAAGPVP